MRSAIRLVILGGCVSLTLTGCASGASSSFTQAPLFFSEAAADEPPADDLHTLAPAATRDRGVANYNAVSGNALLPVNAVLPLDPSPVVAVDALNGDGTIANVAVGNGLPVGATLTVGSGGPSLGATASLPGDTLGVNVTPGLTAAPGLTSPVTTPLATVPAATSLLTAGPVLGAAAPVTPAATQVTGLLNTTATNLAHVCVLKVCR